MILDIVTPAGKIVPVDDPELIQLLGEGLDGDVLDLCNESK
jgi:hypothetical protein